MTTHITLHLDPAEYAALQAEAKDTGADNLPDFVAEVVECCLAERREQMVADWRALTEEGVRFDEGEADAVWLGEGPCPSDGGAAAIVSPHVHYLRIVQAWKYEEGGLGINADCSPPYLNGEQVNRLRADLTDLRQCGNCDYWYWRRGGIICPHCGFEPGETQQEAS
jgi:hypothetical protein